MNYDSTAETLEHIRHVSTNLNNVAIELMKRGNKHDQSKLEDPEKPIFDKYTPELKRYAYGTKEYTDNLKNLDKALEHHYANNTHHPQYYENGVDGMDLMDVVEMYCDWKAAILRSKDGNFEKSLEINEKRFNIAPQLISIFKNTYDREKKASAV